MVGSQLIAGRLADVQAVQNYASGAETNIFANEVHGIVNAHHHDHDSPIQLGQTPTAFNGRTVKFQLSKFTDCFKAGYFRLTTAAAAGATTEAFVNYYGYLAIPRCHIKITNSNYTPQNEVPYWRFDMDRLRYNSRQYMEYRSDSQLAGVPLARRQAALANGHTAIIDLETGQPRHGMENFFWLSALAHELNIVVDLAQASDVIYDPANSGTLITNKATLITGFDLVLSGVTVDEDARAATIAMHNSDDGLYNLLMQPLYWSWNVLPTGAVNGQVDLTFKESRPFTLMTLFIECEDKTQSWQRDPFDIQYPTMTDIAGNTVNFPTHFEVIAGNNNPVITKREITEHTLFEHSHRFVDREANDYIINASMSYFDPLKDNTINAPFAPGVYHQLTLRLYFSGAVASAGSGMRVTMLLHGHNFVHNAHSDATSVIA